MTGVIQSNKTRLLIATLVITGLAAHVPSRTRSAPVAAPTVQRTTLKTRSQYSTEASRYDQVIRAISAIGAMRLDTHEDLQKAVVILQRERLSVALIFAKFVTLAANDSAFTAGVRKKFPNKATTDAFEAEFTADRKAILKLDGASALRSKMQQVLDADGAMIRRVAARLNEAAEKLKRSQPSPSPSPEFVNAGFSFPHPTSASFMTLPSSPVIVFLLLEMALVTAAVVVTVTLFEAAFIWFVAYMTQNVAVTTECEEKVLRDYDNCVALANILPPPFNFTPLTACEAARVAALFACGVLGQQ